MSINKKVEQWFNEMKAEHGLSDDYVLDEGELLNWLAKRKPKLKQCSVSGALPLAQELLRAIIAADPNVKDDYERSDYIIRSLYERCRKLVKKLGGNDR